jgi:site-specific recombinase XerD
MNSEKPILQLMNEYLANKDVGENTRKKYRETLHVFIGWLTRNADVKNPLRSDVLRYKEWLKDSKKAASTIDNYLAAVRQFFTWLEENKIHDNVAAGIHSPKRYHGYRRGYLKPDQVNKLLLSINRNTITGKRDYAIINLMVRAGLRCIEVERTNIKDIRIEEDRWVIYLQGKGHTDKDCVLGLSDKVVAPIREYLNESDSMDEKLPVFRNHSCVSHDTRIKAIMISKIVKKYLRLIGIDSSRMTAHSLRHTAAITAFNSGIPINEIKAMLRHARIETTEIYLSAIEDEKMRDGTVVRGLDNAY